MIFQFSLYFSSAGTLNAAMNSWSEGFENFDGRKSAWQPCKSRLLNHRHCNCNGKYGSAISAHGQNHERRSDRGYTKCAQRMVLLGNTVMISSGTTVRGQRLRLPRWEWSLFQTVTRARTPMIISSVFTEYYDCG